MGLSDDLVDLGGDVVDLVHDGTDVLGDVVTFQVDAAGDVIDATGTVLSATVDAAGQVVDASGKALGAAEDYLSSPYAALGALGPSAYALNKTLAHARPSRSEQVADLAGGQPNADVILDLARDCEQLFRRWRPRMLAAGLSAPTTWDQAASLFDRERGMSFATLRADQAHLHDAARRLDEAVAQQEHEVATLASTWRSDGASAAQTYLRTLTTRGGATAAAVRTLSGTYGRCATELETAVRDKAHALAPLYQETIDGKSPGDVDRIIGAAKGGGLDLELLKLVGVGLGFTFLDGLVVGPLLDRLREEVQRAAQLWLDQVFAPTYRQAESSFLRICDTTTTSVNTVYDTLAAAGAHFDPTVFTPLESDIPAPEPGQGRPRAVDQPAPPPPPAAADPGTSVGGAPAGGAGPAGSGSGGLRGGLAAGAPTSGPLPDPPPVPVATPLTAIAPSGAGTDAAGPPVVPPPASGAPSVSRPPGLPGDAGWVADANRLPPGWTVDPSTAQALPPGAPGAAGDVPTHSPAGPEDLDHDGVGDLGASRPGPAHAGVEQPEGLAPQAPGAGGAPVDGAANGVSASSVTVSGHGVKMEISAQDGGGHGALVTVTDAGGHAVQYRMEVGPGGAPVLAPVGHESGIDAAATGSAAPTLPAQHDVSTPSPPQGVGTSPAGPHAVRSPESPTVAQHTPPPDRAAVSPAGPGEAAPAPAAADGAAHPTAGPAAAVHTAAWQQGWGEGGSGAELAGAGGGSSGADPGAGGGVLAGSEADRPPQGGHHVLGGASPVGPSGLLGSGGAGAESVSRTSHWHVTDDAFAAGSASWANLTQVLGRDDEQHPGASR